MKWYFKLGIIYLLRILLRIFYIVPIKKNRILFSANSGRAYKCNPQYIFEALYKKYGNKLDYIWCVKNKAFVPEQFDVKRVSPLSFIHLYYLMTSKVVISNVGIEPFIPPRKGRIFINTWHGGGAYKKGGLSATYYSKPHRYYFKKVRDLRAKSTTYLISSCQRFSVIFEDEFRLDKSKILPIGMPRNDIFFLPASKQEDIKNKICDRYSIKNDSFIVLYAPTYRGHEADCDRMDWSIDTKAIANAVKQRFGKEPVILYRSHMNVANDKQDIAKAIDVSDYPDMQELLVATDLLISDYSSLVWDYSLTFRPGFLYTPDLEQYCATTKLHTPIGQWQYPYSITIEELCSQITDYEEAKAIAKINEHHILLGSFEKGNATTAIVHLIEEVLK